MSLIYYRITGYVFTLAVHLGNVLVMRQLVNSDLIKGKDLQTFASLQDRYITCWNFGLQIVYATLALLSDLLVLKNAGKPLYKPPKHLTACRETLFSFLCPTTFLVILLYWPLYLYDRELVFPKFIDQVIPFTSNQIMHTVILPVVLWEIALRPRKIPKSHKKYLTILISFFAIYWTTVIITYSKRRVWPYPLLYKVNETGYFPVFITFILILLLLCYTLYWRLVYLIWNQENKSKKFS